MATLAREHGLTINMNKCRSSQLGHKVSFLGAPVAREKLSIAAEAVGKGRAQLARVMGVDISHHAKLTLVRTCVVPMVNYAPLVELVSLRESYDAFDRGVGEAMGNLLGSDPKRWIDFLAAPKDNGGLEVHLPGVYHALLRRAFNSLDIGTGRRDPVGSLKDIIIEGTGYANRVLGALRILPAACGLAPDAPLTTNCSLCGIRRHDAVALWLLNHLATRRRTTVSYEQKAWVDTEARSPTSSP